MFTASGALIWQKPCNIDSVADVAFRDFVIRPWARFRPDDAEHRTRIRIRHSSLARDLWYLCVLDPNLLPRFQTSEWFPSDGCYELIGNEHSNLVCKLGASATEFARNHSVQYSFQLTASSTASRSNHSEIDFASYDANAVVLWNTLTVVFGWSDVLAASASLLSLTIAIFSFLFPLTLPGKPLFKFRLRCCSAAVDSDDRDRAMSRDELVLNQYPV